MYPDLQEENAHDSDLCELNPSKLLLCVEMVKVGLRLRPDKTPLMAVNAIICISESED